MDPLRLAFEQIGSALEEQKRKAHEADSRAAELSAVLESERAAHQEREQQLLDANNRLMSQVENLSAAVASLQAQLVEQTRQSNLALLQTSSSSPKSGAYGQLGGGGSSFAAATPGGVRGVNNGRAFTTVPASARAPPQQSQYQYQQPQQGTHMKLPPSFSSASSAAPSSGSGGSGGANVESVLAAIDRSIEGMRASQASDLQQYTARLMSKMASDVTAPHTPAAAGGYSGGEDGADGSSGTTMHISPLVPALAAQQEQMRQQQQQQRSGGSQLPPAGSGISRGPSQGRAVAPVSNNTHSSNSGNGLTTPARVRSPPGSGTSSGGNSSGGLPLPATPAAASFAVPYPAQAQAPLTSAKAAAAAAATAASQRPEVRAGPYDVFQPAAASGRGTGAAGVAAAAANSARGPSVGRGAVNSSSSSAAAGASDDDADTVVVEQPPLPSRTGTPNGSGSANAAPSASSSRPQPVVVATKQVPQQPGMSASQKRSSSTGTPAPPSKLSAPEFFSLLRSSLPPPALAQLMDALATFNKGRMSKGELLGIAERLLLVQQQSQSATGGGRGKQAAQQGSKVDLFAAFQAFMSRG